MAARTCFILILVAISSAIIGECFVERQAFLSGDWTVPRAETETQVPFGRYFKSERASLVGGALDLGAAHGGNEVIHEPELPLREISFSASFSPDSYLIALFNRDSNGFSGVRFSTSAIFDSIYFEASPDGQFLRKEPFRLGPLKSGTEARLRISSTNSGVVIFQDGTLLHTVAASSKPRQSFGFRNGDRPVLLSSVEVKLDDGALLKFPFSERSSPWPAAAIAFLVLAAALGRPRTRGALSAALAAVVLSSLFLLADREYFSRKTTMPRESMRPRYWPGLHLAKSEALSGAHVQDLSVRGKGLRDPRLHMRAKSAYKVLFVGSAQTMGEGADKPSDRWTERFLQNLRARYGPRFPVEGSFATSFGASSPSLLKLAKEEWAHGAFDLVVVNLSSFDFNRLDLLRSLEGMTSLAQGGGADILFILEPNSVEVDDRFLRLKHQTMLSLAAGQRVPVVDLHYLLSARNTYDSGLLWWDYSILTSYGQRAFSDALSSRFFKLTGRVQ